MSENNGKEPIIKIFVSHRIDQVSETIDNPLYVNVRCGAVYDKRNPEEYGHILGDNTGDNISEKKYRYSELTVQYWAWKNQNADYYGLCHYRRYLIFRNACDDYERDQRDQVQCNYLNKENEKTLTLEERFAHLEQIVARMEDADVSLDEAFELYKKGLDEVKSANDMVQGMEKAMLVLNSDGQLEEF